MDIIDLQYTAFQTNITEFTDDGMWTGQLVFIPTRPKIKPMTSERQTSC
jgi:hypothetical protein